MTPPARHVRSGTAGLYIAPIVLRGRSVVVVNISLGFTLRPFLAAKQNKVYTRFWQILKIERAALGV